MSQLFDIDDVDSAPDFSEFSAIAQSTYIKSLQQAIVQLGRQVNDGVLAVATDGLLGPKTIAAVNKAMSSYVLIAPFNLKNGNLSSDEINTEASALIAAVSGEILRRGVVPAAKKAPAVAVKNWKPTPLVMPSYTPPEPWYVKYKTPLMIGGGVIVAGGIALAIFSKPDKLGNY